MRKTNFDLQGYPNIINPDISKRVGNKNHVMADMPYYDKTTEPEKLHEEIIIESRYKDLCDKFARSFNVQLFDINQHAVMMGANTYGNAMISAENGKQKQLEKLSEKICRKEFNLSKDEIRFDIEIVPIGGCPLPKECEKEKTIPKDFKQSEDPDVLKKRTMNALCQGSALKSHYIFHMYRDEIHNIIPDICDTYQKGLIANDLYYFIIDDGAFCCSSNDNLNAGYVRLRFDEDVPVLEAKAICMPLLIHEITKGIIMFLTIPGIQNMNQETIDETDFVAAELWEIRFGPTFWEKLHGLIDPKDYDIKKLILMDVFNKESEDFLEFIESVMNDNTIAEIEITRIGRTRRNKILNSDFEETFDDIDF